MKNDEFFTIGNYKFKKYIDAATIQEKVKEIAKQITKDYKDKKLTYIIVLKGAFIYASDLIRNVPLPSEILFIDSKSYGKNFKSTGKVTLDLLNIDIKAKDIIIIEDIIDSGKTMKSVIAALRELNPASVKITAILSKPSMREVSLDIDYLGFEMPPKFIVGYGLDYAEEGRHLPDIYIKID